MRLIDADELLAHRFVGVVGEAEKSSYMVGWNTAIEAVVENAPTIDAVPIVRCRECKNWETDWELNHFNQDNPMYYCAETDLFTSGDWFCKDGQRREDGEA